LRARIFDNAQNSNQLSNLQPIMYPQIVGGYPQGLPYNYNIQGQIPIDSPQMFVAFPPIQQQPPPLQIHQHQQQQPFEMGKTDELDLQ